MVKLSIIVEKIVNELIDTEDKKNLISSFLLNIKNTDTFYKNIIFMNKGSNIGKFAISYRKNLYDSLNTMNIDKLHKTMECITNLDKTNKHYSRFKKEYDEEMIKTIHLIKSLEYKDNLPSQIFIPETTCVWVSYETKSNKYSYCFDLIFLLFLLKNNRHNPYTKQLFSDSFKKDMEEKYEYELYYLSLL